MERSFRDIRLIAPPEADGEYLGLGGRGSEEVVHLHDYERLYRVPGLYEHVVQVLLECRSPQVAAQALGRSLRQLSLNPAHVTVLDLGAGTGLVGELVRGLGIASVVGLDALPAARVACSRDRPGVYRGLSGGRSRQPAARAR